MAKYIDIKEFWKFWKRNKIANQNKKVYAEIKDLMEK